MSCPVLFPDFIASYFGKDSPVAPVLSNRNSKQLRAQRHRTVKGKVSTINETDTDTKPTKVEPILTEAKISTPIETDQSTLFEKIETRDFDTEVLGADNVPEQDNTMSVKSCYTPEQLSYYIDSEKYFGNKQKHTPLIQSTSMSNVISALYIPASKKKVTEYVKYPPIPIQYDDELLFCRLQDSSPSMKRMRKKLPTAITSMTM